MSHSDNFSRLCKAIDAQIESWQRADRITALEQREHTQQIIYGIVFAGLYILTNEEYFDLVAYVHDKGFNH